MAELVWGFSPRIGQIRCGGLQREYEDVLFARTKADAERRVSRRHLAE